MKIYDIRLLRTTTGKEHICFFYKTLPKKRINETEYLQRRGISKEVQDRYNIGYDPNFKNGTWKALIIPTTHYSFTARNTDVNSEDRLRKVGKSEIFNYWELEQNKKENFYIVEGEIDALSVAEIGKKAIALGSVNNINLFINKLKNDFPENKFYLMLDNDNQGIKAQEELYGNWDISLNSIYRSLDKLDKIKEDLQIHLHKEISKITNRTANLVFYDVTNYYFETDSIEKLQHKAKYDELSQEKLEKEMRRKGPSKEHRPEPIIQLGLFMDTNGIPISYKLFKGNQTDPITYLPAIETIKKQFGIERLIVVADKAMNSSKNVSYMSEGNDGWVFSQKHRGKRGAPKDIQNFILEDKDWEVNEEMTFAKKSFIRERKIEGKKVKEQVLVTWNKKYAQREQARREGALDYARKLTQPQLYRMTSKKGGKKYLEVRLVDPKTGEILPYKPTITLDEDQINFDAQFDGINVIVTSELTMSDEEIISAYGELSEIEDCFRVTKSQLETRPVYVRTPEHIQGHFLTCFLALIHVRLLQYKTNKQMSSERIINALKTAKATKLNQGYYRLQESEDMKLLNKLPLMGMQIMQSMVLI